MYNYKKFLSIQKVPPMEEAVQEQKEKLPRYDEKIGVLQVSI